MAKHQHSVEGRSTQPGGARAKLWWIVGGLGLVALCAGVRYLWGHGAANAAPPGKQVPAIQQTAGLTTPPTEEQKRNQVMATVNGEKITRQQLSDEALLHYGNDVLEALLNKTLILEACSQRGIGVTQDEVAAKIDRMAQRFGVATDQWLKMLKEERQISPQQYAKDIIWPTVALRKLAEQRVQPTDVEVQQAYETQFGPTVQARLIVVADVQRAQ